MPETKEGVTLLGVFAADIDQMITPADEFQIVAVVRAPNVSRVTLRLSGAPFLKAQQSFDLQPGDNWLQIADFKVDTELEAVIREEVIRKVGGTISIRDGALVLAVDFADASGTEKSAVFQPVVYDFNRPERIARVEYPDLKQVTGLPENGASEANYYLHGDADFHHGDDYYVRKLAVEMGRRGGIFPDDAEKVADNIFNYIDRLLGDAEPGDFNNDYNISRLLDDGTIKRGQINGGYICIGQTYLMTSMTRTLGLPSRELNIAVGRPNFLGNDGIWRVTWWQEGALQTWYNGQWNHYDLWLGFKGLDGYFQKNLAFQAWATFNPQKVQFMTAGGLPTGLWGHNFNLFPGNPAQFEFIEEGVKPGLLVMGMPGPDGEPVGVSYYQPDLGGAYLKSNAEQDVRRPAGIIATPPAMEINALPETR